MSSCLMTYMIVSKNKRTHYSVHENDRGSIQKPQMVVRQLGGT
jgi:hypothetical protein